MKQNVPPLVVAIAAVVVLALVGFFAYRFVMPNKTLVKYGTPMPPMPQAPAARVLPPR